jgi:hypothetical protein
MPVSIITMTVTMMIAVATVSDGVVVGAGKK